MKLSAQQKIFSFPEQLKAAREYAGVSQRQMALKIGIKPQFLCEIESGKKKPSYNTMVHIFEYFKLFKIVFDFTLK